MNRECRNCSAFAEHGRGAGQPHECRAKSPAVQIIGANQNAITRAVEPVIASFWPTVKPDNWCRDFAPRLEMMPAAQPAMWE